MPAPFVKHETSQYDTQTDGQQAEPSANPGRMPNPDCCPECWGYTFHRDECAYDDGQPRLQTRMSWKPIRRALLLSIPIWICLCILGLLIVHSAQAREGGIKPIPAPPALLKERAECNATRTVETCLRSKLRTAYASLEWARKERQHRSRPYGVDHALKLAAALYGVPLSELRGVGECESHLTPTSKNRTSTAAGLFQFLDSTWLRAGIPGFSVYDPYANAIAAARLVRTDGSWREWSCQP